MHTHNINLVNRWRAVLDRYNGLQEEAKDLMTEAQWEKVRENQLRNCVFIAGKNWLHWLGYPKEEREKHREDLREMSRFVQANLPVFGDPEWELPLRICSFLIRYPNKVSLLLARGLNLLTSGRKRALY